MRSDGSESTFTERARRTQIMACAVQVLAELGFGGATLAEIARRAGVAKGVVSYYFAGKDDLLMQVLLDVYGRAGAAIAQRVEEQSEPAAKIRAYVEANMQFLAQHPADIRAVVEIAASARRPDGSLRFAPQGEDPVLSDLERLLRAGQRTASSDQFDARSLAILIRGAIDTASGRVATDPAFDLSAYTRELVRVIELAIDPPAKGQP